MTHRVARASGCPAGRVSRSPPIGAYRPSRRGCFDPIGGDYRDASIDVRRDIRDHHGVELADCDRIREHAVGMFENWTGRGIESTADGLVMAIFARSADTFTCACQDNIVQ